MTYEYKIGTTLAGLTLLSDLGIPYPRHGFVRHAQYNDMGDGSMQGNGWKQDEWFWGFITQAQRDTLRIYIPQNGSHIFVRDLKDDGVTWANFECESVWPQNEDRQAGRRLSFTIILRAMVEV